MLTRVFTEASGAARVPGLSYIAGGMAAVRFDVEAWRAERTAGPLLSGTDKILNAVDPAGEINGPRWGQLVRYHGSAEVFQQLWVLGRLWPITSRMRLYGSFLQRQDVVLPLSVLAGAAADLTAAMIRTPTRASSDHIRWFVHGCLEWHLRRHLPGADVFASAYLALWDRVTEESFTDAEHLLLWRILARTIQRAPVYWPSGTRVAMMPSILASTLDDADMPPALTAALLLVTSWNVAAGVAVASRVLPLLRQIFLDYTAARPTWRMVLEDALEDGPWPSGIPRLEGAERRAAQDELWRRDFQPDDDSWKEEFELVDVD